MFLSGIFRATVRGGKGAASPRFARARSMKTLTHFLDTPKRSEISALLNPLPISLTTCDSRRLNNVGRASLMVFCLLRFLFILVRKSILPETV